MSVKIIGKIDLDNQTTKEDIIIAREYYRGGNIRFTAPCWISRELAMQLQMELSYHPAGYGFYGYKATPTGTTWYCWNCCD